MFYVTDRKLSDVYRVVNTSDWSVLFKTRDDILKDIKAGAKYLGMNCGKKMVIGGEIAIPFIADVLDYFYTRGKLSGDSYAEQISIDGYTERRFSLVVNGFGLVISYPVFNDYKIEYQDDGFMSVDTPLSVRRSLIFDYRVVLCSVFFVSTPKRIDLVLPDFITAFDTKIGCEKDKITKGSFSSLNDLLKGCFMNLVLPERLTTLVPGAFCGCRYIQSVSFGFTRHIPKFCFSDCPNLKNMWFRPKDVALFEFENTGVMLALDGYAFANSGLSEVYIPYYVSCLGESCFECCSDLTRVKINGVGSIGERVFRNCTSLIKCDFSCIVGSRAFKPWFLSEDSIYLCGLQCIGSEAFLNCAELRSITVDSNTHIFVSEDTFVNCSSLHKFCVTTDYNQVLLKRALSSCGINEDIIQQSNVTSF